MVKIHFRSISKWWTTSRRLYGEQLNRDDSAANCPIVDEIRRAGADGSPEATSRSKSRTTDEILCARLSWLLVSF